MAGAFIELTIANSAEVKAAFEALQAKLADLTPVFQDIGEEMLNRTRDRFRSHTAPIWGVVTWIRTEAQEKERRQNPDP